MHSSVQFTARVQDDVYDTLLSENVVFLQLYDSSCNNAIIECIARGTPLLVNKIPPVREYLEITREGDDYPLYYDTLEEASAKLSDTDLIHKAHRYLMETLPIRQRLTAEKFCHDIVTSDVYHKVLQTHVPPNDIGMRYMYAILTKQECEQVIAMTHGQFEQSRVIIGTSMQPSQDRTSTSYYLPEGGHAVVTRLKERVAELAHLPVTHVEGIQVVRYTPGQLFRAHYDSFSEEYAASIGNQRKYTMFVWLTDCVQGGETEFPLIPARFAPTGGDALWWENCDAHEHTHPQALHQGNPPSNQIKYGLNIWVCFRPWQLNSSVSDASNAGGASSTTLASFG
jgi:hypothetical protein